MLKRLKVCFIFFLLLWMYQSSHTALQHLVNESTNATGGFVRVSAGAVLSLSQQASHSPQRTTLLTAVGSCSTGGFGFEVLHQKCQSTWKCSFHYSTLLQVTSDWQETRRTRRWKLKWNFSSMHLIVLILVLPAWGFIGANIFRLAASAQLHRDAAFMLSLFLCRVCKYEAGVPEKVSFRRS